MESIEERADRYLQSQGLFRGACASQISYGAGCMYDGYIQGDADRKSIDIEKAKEAFNKTCGWLAVYPWYNGLFEEFVKAMEE